MQYGHPGLGETLESAAAQYATMFPKVTHSVAREWLNSARQCKRSQDYRNRRSLQSRQVAERVKVARVIARAARIASRETRP